jgi:carboxypeptidase Taq
MSISAPTTFDQLCAHVRETALLQSIDGLLNWDERTYMPTEAGAYRAEQITYMSGLVHRRRTDPQLGEWLNTLLASDLSTDRHSDTGATIHELKREYDKRVKLPQALVEELARAAVLGQQAWVKARHDDDFASFRPFLEKIYRLKAEEAQALGYVDHPYDALLDDYEPGAKTAHVAQVLAGLRSELVPLVRAIAEAKRRPSAEVLKCRIPTAVQEQFGKEAAAAIGFDFQRGRLDVTHHPFCSGMGPHDCRITTRYDESFFPSSFFGILHEAGHGIYEQGLRADWYGLPPGSFVSLGIHESQSRLWENAVGRSRAFWSHFYPKLQQASPGMSDVALDDFHFAINGVQPSLIRVEADEATYNLHIIIRFELEQAILTGDLPIGELPAAWNEKYREYLGIAPPSDADGCLQDIHWSAGLIGYFPTYSLGNLYAAQFYDQADHDLGGLAAQFARGEFQPLREWLREKIHARGQCYTATQLAEVVTGRPLSHASFMNYLRGKLEPLYHLA